MNPLSSQQKVALLREMDNKVSISFLMALNFFEDNINKLSQKKQEEFKKLIENMNAEIKKLQLKDGAKGDKGDKGDRGDDADEQKIIEEISRRIKLPKDGKNAVVNYDFIFDYILGKIKVPKDGKDGKDGSPDRPIELATKLNTLEEKVDQKVIRGLDRRFKGIEISLRDRKERGGGGGQNGGGGMGNFQHETKNLTSATTQVTTNYKISGAGYAIVGIYYQGQFIVRGTGYTVNSDYKTLPLLFTPVNGTFLDIVYIRG